MFWAPRPTGEPFSTPARAEREIKGGQMTTSTPGMATSLSFKAPARARASGRVVFIFQFPAIRGLLGAILHQFSGMGQGQGEDMEGGEEAQAPTAAGPLPEFSNAVRTAGGGVEKEGHGVPAMALEESGGGMVAGDYQDLGLEGQDPGELPIHLLNDPDLAVKVPVLPRHIGLFYMDEEEVIADPVLGEGIEGVLQTGAGGENSHAHQDRK